MKENPVEKTITFYSNFIEIRVYLSESAVSHSAEPYGVVEETTWTATSSHILEGIIETLENTK